MIDIDCARAFNRLAAYHLAVLVSQIINNVTDFNLAAFVGSSCATFVNFHRRRIDVIPDIVHLSQSPLLIGQVAVIVAGAEQAATGGAAALGVLRGAVRKPGVRVGVVANLAALKVLASEYFNIKKLVWFV